MTIRAAAERDLSRRATVGAVDLGGGHVACAVADRRGRILGRERRNLEAADGPSTVLPWIADAVRSLLRAAGIRPSSLRAVGFAAPGLIDTEAGRIKGTANLPGWRGAPLADELGALLDAPVRLENDGNMAALGEWWCGAGAGRGGLLFVALGTGIGGGLIIEGRIVRGSHSFAGEIGYTCLGAEYLGVDFGGSGCLEHMTAGPGVVRRAREVLGARLPQAASARDVFDLALEGDPDAVRVRDEMAASLGIAIGNAAALIDPDVVVLGGGMSRHGEPLLAGVREAVAQIVPVRPDIVLSSLGEEAQLYGAVYAALETAGLEPKRSTR